MAPRHFRCTACGKCCHGQLPLTCKDAFANAGRFPLSLVWTPLRQGSKDFSQVAALGATIKLPGGKKLAVLIVPTVYLPASFPCPALGDDNLCTIHLSKPSRCQTMPFYPYREERFQAELLIPRPGWACDTSATAPIVFQDNKVVSRACFDHERQELLEQVPVLRGYADYMLKYSPALIGSLCAAASKTRAGHVFTSLSSFLTATKNSEATHLAQLQLPILNHYLAKTAGNPQLADFYKNYLNWSKEMAYLAQRPL